MTIDNIRKLWIYEIDIENNGNISHYRTDADLKNWELLMGGESWESYYDCDDVKELVKAKLGADRI